MPSPRYRAIRRRDGTILDVDPGLASLIGTTREAMIGRPGSEFVSATVEQRSRTRATLRLTGRADGVGTLIHQRTGELIRVRFRATRNT